MTHCNIHYTHNDTHTHTHTHPHYTQSTLHHTHIHDTHHDAHAHTPQRERERERERVFLCVCVCVCVCVCDLNQKKLIRQFLSSCPRIPRRAQMRQRYNFVCFDVALCPASIPFALRRHAVRVVTFGSRQLYPDYNR